MCGAPRPNGCRSPSGNCQAEPTISVDCPDCRERRNAAACSKLFPRTTGAGNAGVPHMRINWLGTAAIALILGTGSAFAQQSDLQRRDEGGARPSLPNKGAERPGGAMGGMNDRAAQREGGAMEPRRSEGPSSREQAQEGQQLRDRQPTRQSQDQMGRERPTVGQTQPKQDERTGRDRTQAVDQKQQQGRDAQQKLD